MKIKDARGFWNLLSALELSISPKIAEMLKPFLQPVTDCYECGVEVPTLGNRKYTKDVYVAGLFLKRLLNDIRVVWNLLLLGYTSQAGTVAAAAFENALIICAVVGNAERAEKLLKSGGSPWSVADLCKIYAQKSAKKSNNSAKNTDEIDYDTHWRGKYAIYMWLCKLKHPHMASALHDAFSVSLGESQYGIMAAPDDRIEDLPNKAFVLAVTLLHTIDAIESFANARKLDSKDPKVISWQKRFESIGSNYSKAIDPIISSTKLPFDYRGHMIKREKKIGGTNAAG